MLDQAVFASKSLGVLLSVQQGVMAAVSSRYAYETAEMLTELHHDLQELDNHF